MADFRRLRFGDGLPVKSYIRWRPAQWDALQREAGRRNVSLSALVRDLVDQSLLEVARDPRPFFSTGRAGQGETS